MYNKKDLKKERSNQRAYEPMLAMWEPALNAWDGVPLSQERPPANLWKKRDQSRQYRNGNSLRDYQLEGVNWLLFNWYNRSALRARTRSL